MRLGTRFGLAGTVCAALAFLSLLAAPEPAAAKGGGAGTRPPVDAGTVYYIHKPALNPDPFTSWKMQPDGTGRSQLTAVPPTAVPSRALHGGERWFLLTETVSGTYPDGDPRRELFAVSESGAHVQLTASLDVEPDGVATYVWDAPNWAPDAGVADGKVSYMARRWASDGSALLDWGIYVLRIDWDRVRAGTWTPAAPAWLSQVPVSRFTATLSYSPLVRGEMMGARYDWSSDGTTLVLERNYVAADGTIADRDLLRIGADGSNPAVVAGAGMGVEAPCWSHVTDRIAWNTSRGAIWSADSDGTDPALIVKESPDWGRYHRSSPKWSPNGTHLVYLYYDQGRSIASDTVQAIDRCAADGSGTTRLVSVTNGRVNPTAWR